MEDSGRLNALDEVMLSAFHKGEKMYPLTGEVQVVSSTRANEYYICVGTTGLIISTQEDQGVWQWLQDYTPDDRINPPTDPVKKVAYTTRYAYALNHLLHWWEKLDPQAYPFGKAQILEGETNHTSCKFRKKLLGGAFCYIDEGEGVHDYIYTLDLNAAVMNPERMNRLVKLSNRAEREIKHVLLPVHLTRINFTPPPPIGVYQ